MASTFRTIHSPETGTDYRIFIEKPSEAGSWPVVLFMDGDDQFAAAVQAYQAQRTRKQVPPLLLVGVGYGSSYLKPSNRRGRDYTPVAHTDEPSSGGGDAFLRFLTTTLWPELARSFPIDDSKRAIAGHSLGSLLVLHALFQPQPFFTHFLASAPSIWWAERAIVQQAAKLRAVQAGLPGRLFLCVGQEDTPSMTGDLALLEQQLAANPFGGLRITSHRFAGRNHYDVLPEAFATGLAVLFGERTNQASSSNVT